MSRLLVAGVVTATLATIAIESARAAPIQPLEAIEQAVRRLAAERSAADADSEVTIGRLDPRLRLPLCGEPLTTRFSHGNRNSGAMSIEVRCEGDKPWSLYVPVTVAHFAEVVVAARPLARGHVVSADDLDTARQRVDLARHDYLVDPANAVGQVTRRSIGVGQMLGAAQLERPHVVRRGDQVTLSSGGQAVSVSVRGTALADGSVGERIRVRNLSSKRVVEGVVTAAGAVVVQAGAML
ncbi:MAG: flagellar basal body P-ring formation chaperone FlgA [Gammaproteobacteria bacterium]